MDSSCIKRLRRKNVLLLIFCIACIVSAGFPGRLNADIGAKRLKRAIEHFQQASSLYKSKRIDDAIAEYRKALHDDPEEPYWHEALANALKDKGDLQGALEEYRIASLQSPLDTGLRSRYEKSASKLHVNVEPGNVEAKPAKIIPINAEASKLGAEVTAPVPTYHPEPRYSDKARNIKYGGIVVLLIVVNAQGDVTSTSIVKPLGAGLDEKSLETVRTWKFKPAMRGTDAVPVRLYVETNFKIY